MTCSKFIWVDGRRIHFRTTGGEIGNDPGVVLLHGGGTDCASLSWDPLLREWKGRLSVVAPDLPGHGLSAKPPEGYTASSATAFLERFLDALRMPTVDLVGLSLGGLAALGFERRRPDRVRKLVLVAGLGLGPYFPYLTTARVLTLRGPAHTRLRRLFADRPRLLRIFLRFLVERREILTPQLLAEIGRELRRPGSGHGWHCFLRRELGPKGLRTHFGERLEEIRTPTLILHGRRDRLIPARLAVEAHRRMPHSRLHLFDDCGHWPPRELPVAFRNLLEEFLVGA